MSILEVSHLRKSFGDTQVLRDISFSLEQGQTLSLIGPKVPREFGSSHLRRHRRERRTRL